MSPKATSPVDMDFSPFPQQGILVAPDRRFHYSGTWLYYIGRFFLRIVGRLLFHLEVVGEENVPRSGPVIIAPNHISYLDPPLVGSALRRPTYFMAKEELFRNRAFGWLISRTHAFPVKRGVADRAALLWTLGLLKRGEMVLMFPEGTRSKTGELQRGEPGIARIILKSGAPVVPVAVQGTNHPILSWWPLPKFNRLRVSFGRALRFDEFAARRPREAAQTIADRIIEEIRLLQRDMGSLPSGAALQTFHDSLDSEEEKSVEE